MSRLVYNGKARYIRGVGLIAQQIGSNTHYYCFNGHGDVIQRIDQSQNATPLIEYDSFGNQRGRIETDLDTDPNPFRYCGEYFDIEANTLYLRNRSYDARNGRFTQEDPIGSGLNWYSYCDGDPVNFVDPSGFKQSYLYNEAYMNEYILDDGVIDDDEILDMYENAANGPDDFSPEAWEMIMNAGLAELFEGRTDSKGPGHEFDSEREAAIDAAKYMAPISIYFDWEFGAYIYEWEEEKKKWFGGTKAVKYYSYTTPHTDKNAHNIDLDPDAIVPRGKMVAAIHSHGAESGKDYKDDLFSGDSGDIGWAKNAGIRLYLITPSGTLKRYTPPKDGNPEDIYSFTLNIMPHDANATLSPPWGGPEYTTRKKRK